jgi:hypothetical protein
VTATSLRRRSVAAVIAVAALLAGCGLQSPLPNGDPNRDPNVRGTFPGQFFWATSEPTKPIGPIEPDAARATVDRAAAVLSPTEDLLFGITIVATFPTADDAEAAAADVESILETSATWYADRRNERFRTALHDPTLPVAIVPPEIDSMKAHLLAPGTRGIGWGGEPGTADDAVYTLGPMVFVTGLKVETPDWPEGAPAHPLAHLLAAQGADVLLEGDRFGEGSIVADLSCRVADRQAGGPLLDEVTDAMITGPLYARPPWIGDPLTAEEALARATYRRWENGITAGIDGSRLADLGHRWAEASTQEERDAGMRELEDFLKQQGLSHLDGEVDPATLALIVDSPGITDADAYAAWTAKIADRMGGLELDATDSGPRPKADDYAQLAFTGTGQLTGNRLQLGWVAFGRFAAAMPKLAAYLTERGCDDIKLEPVDFDAVRGD